ncbi:hypothetical protein SNOG_09270 [Parastagonospora nodorum SN15]|uniref:Thiaminase-2/PQQC domain-containing protein n=1 Tax=Phaeosphaeria nodorum (strain SN15 / ATCC MYA-4574 / FGSC 10173) TaxID=321614 RepID=Q0UG44_PHANO|nr:hypothetical protein SNOG_09270 [Parastagonospora nodorum SN15]EAT83462.2 hypothetical protein SNOG_09270 [Parastagonospora nodorum SN15]
MPIHHPGTLVANGNINLTDVPWALTTHLLSWLANDLQYLKIYKGLSEQTLAIVRRTQPSTTIYDPEDLQTRLVAWLDAAIQNGTREEAFFQEVAEIYKIDLNITQATKNEGLHRYESLLNTFTATSRSEFLPWLEGAVMLWAMEKVYYEAWSWARRQDAQSSPRTYENDEDGGAMRREFIPNWSNRDFMMFVEQLERILNEAVSSAVKGDDQLWRQVKTRTDAVWQAVLDAEEAFWPDVDGVGVNGAANGSALNDVNGIRTSADVDCANHDEGEGDTNNDLSNKSRANMEFKDPTASLLLTEDSINPQTNRLPAIEALPTDLLQQISEDLIYTCHRKADPTTLTYEFIYPNGICQLRASSKTLRANSERAFARCFRLTSVQFNGTGLSRLVELSLSDKYASLLRIIIFHPAADSQTIATAKTTPLEAGGENMAKLRHYVTEHAPETTFMIFALARLKGLYSVIIGPMFQLWPDIHRA